MQHTFKLGEAVHALALSRGSGHYRLHGAAGTPSLAVALETDAQGQSWVRMGHQRLPVVIATRGDDVFVHLDGEAYQLRYQHPLDRLAAHGGSAAEDSVRAPMPGSIVQVAVQAGDAVTKGQTLLVMESMKMETTIAASRDGVVDAIHFAQGQTFDRDAVLLSLVALEKQA